MPGSPGSSAVTSQRHTTSTQATKTRRSIALSAAFNNAPTQVGSGLASEHSSPPPPSQLASSRVSKGTSVGTMVNPAATASELMTKSPSLKQASDRMPTSLSPVSSLKAGPGASASSPPASTSVSRTGAGSQAKEHASGSTKGAPERSGTSSSQTDPEVSQANVFKSNVGHGVIDVNMRRGALIQIAFSVLAFFLFLALWIYLIAAAGCFRKPMWDFFMKCFSMAGVICSLFVIFHSCFDRQVSTRGVFGCVIFFVITIVVFLNILVGFLAMNCICKCPPDTNAYSEGSVSDLTIFGFSIAGAFCLVIVLLVASVAHN